MMMSEERGETAGGIGGKLMAITLTDSVSVEVPEVQTLECVRRSQAVVGKGIA